MGVGAGVGDEGGDLLISGLGVGGAVLLNLRSYRSCEVSVK